MGRRQTRNRCPETSPERTRKALLWIRSPCRVGTAHRSPDGGQCPPYMRTHVYLRWKLHELKAVLALVSVLFALPLHAASPAAQQLARECDELIAQAIRRPYGWAFSETEPEAKPHGGGQLAALEPPGSAGAGFVLYWAGDLLEQPKFKQAAYQVARSVVAAQRPTGQIPALPMF